MECYLCHSQVLEFIDDKGLSFNSVHILREDIKLYICAMCVKKLLLGWYSRLTDKRFESQMNMERDKFVNFDIKGEIE